MSEVQFNRATEIVETLPETGPFSPTVEDKLEASTVLSPSVLSLDVLSSSYTSITSKVCSKLIATPHEMNVVNIS